MRLSLILLLSLVLISIGCEEKSGVVPKPADSLNYANMPDQISYDIEVAFIDSNYTKAVLNAKRARVYQSRFETWLDYGLTVQFLSKLSGKRISVLTADSAKIDDKTRNMFAYGKVLVVSDSTNTRLETSVLEWDNAAQKIYATEFVRIITPKETIEGYGLESDPALENYKIFRVSGVKR